MSFAIDSTAVAAMLATPNLDGTYPPEMASYLSAICHKHPVILFTFPPKSGGTFLRTAAIHAVNGQLFRVCYSQGGREAQFYLPTFLHYYLSDNVPNMVAHVHMQARPGNCNFIEALDLKPVTMIRSIPDMLVSSRDMFLNEKGMLAESVSCEIPENFAQLSDCAQAEFLTELVAPWYVAYYASWVGYALAAPGRVLVLRFDDFHEHPVDVLLEVLDHSGIDCSFACCEEAVGNVWKQRDQFRYNKGVAGRGHAFFSDAQLDTISNMIAQYPVLEAYRDELL